MTMGRMHRRAEESDSHGLQSMIQRQSTKTKSWLSTATPHISHDVIASQPVEMELSRASYCLL